MATIHDRVHRGADATTAAPAAASPTTSTTSTSAMIKTPGGKLISKNTAVIMLNEFFTATNGKAALSKDRLRRIEQCATRSREYMSTVEEHGGKFIIIHSRTNTSTLPLTTTSHNRYQVGSVPGCCNGVRGWGR